MAQIEEVAPELAETANRLGSSVWVLIVSVFIAAVSVIVAFFSVRTTIRLARDSIFNEIFKVRYSIDYSRHSLSIIDLYLEAGKAKDSAIRIFLSRTRTIQGFIEDGEQLEEARRYLKGFFKMVQVHHKRLLHSQRDTLDVPGIASFYYKYLRNFDVPGLQKGERIPQCKDVRELQKEGKIHCLLKVSPDSVMDRFYRDVTTKDQCSKKRK